LLWSAPERLAPRGQKGDLVSANLPTVTLAVVASDGWEATFRCLFSLVRASPRGSVETVVVDNATRDESSAALRALEGVGVVRNERPVEFAVACNQAVAQARGEVVVLLDRDAEVEPGWLEPVLAPFADPAVAAVVPAAAPLAGALLALRARAVRQAGGFEEARSDAAADALLAALDARGHRIATAAPTGVRLHAAAVDASPARPPLSIVVPVGAAAPELRACLESLGQNLRPGDEIVVSDGGCSDEALRSAYQFAAARPRQVRVVVSRGPATLPGAARDGLASAAHDVALVFHPAAAAPQGFVDGLMELLARNPASQAIGVEVPRAGVCVAGPRRLLRTLSGAGAEALFRPDGAVALADELGKAGARLALVPAR
jgi:GT2 family glycosyltransferase